MLGLFTLVISFVTGTDIVTDIFKMYFYSERMLVYSPNVCVHFILWICDTDDDDDESLICSITTVLALSLTQLGPASRP